MTTPLYQNRIGVINFINVLNSDPQFSEHLTFTDKDILLLLSHPWADMIELHGVLEDYRLTTWAIEKHCNGSVDITMALQKLIDGGLDIELYRQVNTALFGGMLPDYYEREGGFDFNLSAARVSVIQPGKYDYTINNGWKTQRERYPLIRTRAITAQPLGRVDAQALLSLYMFLFGQQALSAPEPIFSLEPFSAESTATIRQALAHIDTIAERGEPIIMPHTLAGFVMEDLPELKVFLTKCQKIAQAFPQPASEQAILPPTPETGERDKVYGHCGIAALLGVSVGTSKLYKRKQNLPHTAMPNKRIWGYKDEILAWHKKFKENERKRRKDRDRKKKKSIESRTERDRKSVNKIFQK